MPLWNRARQRLHLKALARVAAAPLGLLFTAIGQPAQLPVPCGAGNCIPGHYVGTTPGFQTPPAGFVTSGQATATSVGNTLTVSQTSDQAILNWASFNVSADGKVTFQQPSATSIALNKIYQASPSSIFGQVTANGQLYLINPNGFVFGSSATVNVAGLIASSLGLYNGDPELASGILSPIHQPTPAPALASDSRVYVTDSSGNVVLDANGKRQPVQVIVQPGAQLTAASGGRLLLAGQQVENGGSLSAPDGQIILAAGQSVYLAASGNDPNLRGLIVEVNNNATPGNGGTPSDLPVGTVTNDAGGTLSAARGNVSLIGLAVNQSGRISATTAVSANGSVILQAAAGLGNTVNNVTCSNSALLCATQGGTLTLGPTSEIDVLPEVSDTTTTAAAAATQLQSKLTLTGQQVDIKGGQINAPGGSLAVLAAANPDVGLKTEGNTAAQIRVAPGTSINLAGSDASLPMSANLLSIQLRANELADDPQQRNNAALHGQTVIVDMRAGRPAIISDPAWISALSGVQQNIAQRTSHGGSVTFKSEGDVVVNSGATINVSGGRWTYASGVTQTSQLIGINGRTYNISTANPLLTYTGVLNPTFTQTYNGLGIQLTQPTPGFSHFAPGYVQGFSAGSVQFAAPSMSLQGTLVGSAVNGPYQRNAAAIPRESFSAMVASIKDPNNTNPETAFRGMAFGGTLTIGDTAAPSGAGGLPYFFSPAVSFAASVAPVIVADGTPLPPQTLELPASYLTSSGFARTQIYGDSTVTLPAGLPLNLGVGGSLQVAAPRIVIGSDIQALAGKISLQSAQTADYASATLPRLGIDIADGVTLDVRGQWTNDSPLSRGTTVAPTYQNGGEITLSLTSPLSPNTSGGELVIGNNVNFEVSGGAWVKANNTVVGGTGGNITLDASPYQSALQVGHNVALDAFGVKGAAGGTFSLSAPRVTVGQGDGSWAGSQRIDDLSNPGAAFDLGAGLFSQYGFSAVNLTGTAPVQASEPNTDVVTVRAGTLINAQAQTLQLSSGYLTRPTGGTFRSFANLVTLPAFARTPESISFKSVPGYLAAKAIGDVNIQKGVNITTDPGSTITLQSQGSILVDGVVRAPAGTIRANIELPITLTDPGFLPNQRIELGPQAVLDVSGTTVMTPNRLNLAHGTGTVMPGGQVSIQAARGEVIADAGSSIDFSGASALLDTKSIGGGYAAATIGSAGGSLLVQASESISLLGQLSAAAGVSSAGTLQGGSLEVHLVPVGSANTLDPNALPFPATPLTIDLVSSTAGASPTASYGNLAVLGITQLEQSGIDVLKLQSDNTIALNSDTPLSLGREISLDARNIAVSYATNASLKAPYIALTDSSARVTKPQTASGGTGALAVSAQQIVLSGYIGLQGVGSTTLTSSGDVELAPVSISQLAGGLTVAGDLTINASRIYPATNTPFTITDSSTTGTIKIGQSTASHGAPLSAGGSLTINAANIDSSGTVLAPFGSITLAASNSLTLESGSVTSVSAEGATVPYGQTSLGQGEWVYAAGSSTSRVTGVPSRQVSLTAPNVSFKTGATINLSGGGDLSAYEWVPGTRGSVDALSQANAAPAGLYAVLPSTMGQYAAYDLQEFTGSNVDAASSVYLSGVSGLASGVYPLLPARYALLPGAYLIQVESAFQSLKPGVIGALSDGTPVVAGYKTFGNTGLQSSAGYTGFAVWPGSYSQSLAQYTLNTASGFFAAQAARAGQTRVVLPADAGTLLIRAGKSLDAMGNVASSAATGGSAATIEISATDLTVNKDGSPSAAANGGVTIGAPVLQSWNAGDLILGGELSADGSSINVTANTVTIGAGAQFSAGQVLAVADQGIDVKAGAIVASNSGISGTALKTLPSSSPLTFCHPPACDGTPATADPGASLLVVSDTSLPTASRAGGAVTGGGKINIEAGATLKTRGAVALDAPAGVVVTGDINAPGASWSLGSNSIAFVGAGSSPITSSDTLQIGSALSSEMAAAGAVRLASAGAIDLSTAVMLGASGTSSPPTLGSLTLVADSINNTAGAGSVFGAQTLTLQGVGVNSPTPTSGSGTLTLVANTLNIGGTNLAINGNSKTNLQVSGAVVGRAAGAAGQDTGTLGIAGDLSITAAVLTAASPTPASVPPTAGSTSGGTSNAPPKITGTTIAPTGILQIAQNGTAASASSMTSSLGGNLRLTASQIQDAGSIVVPGGRISLQATSDLNLSSSAVVDAGGITVTAGDQTRGAAGGIVNIGALGNLTLAKGSSINVAGAGKAPGGYLTLMGGKDVTVEGTITGGAAADSIGGTFALTAGGRLVDGLSSLATSLSSSGFTNQISVRAGSGNLDLASGNSLTAGRITLTADTGAVDISGALTAPAAGQSGFIGLYGGTGVTLLSGSVLEADGIASAGHGGEIEISSTCTTCTVTLNSGSTIKTSGGTDLGRLLIEAPMYGSNDVAINVGHSGLGADVSGVGKVILEPVLVDSSATNATIATQLANDLSQMSTYLSSATTTITSRLTPASASGKSPVISVQGGVQIVDTKNETLTLPSLVDLSIYSNPAAVAQPQVLNLTVRAAGGLTIGANISDGYNNGELYNSGADSASLRFVAGADLNSANPLATPVALAGSTGADLNIGTIGGAPALVSTGTGDIALVASGNVNFTAGSSAFTTGTLGAPSGSVRVKGQPVTQDFAADGGNVMVNAGGDVIGAPVQVSVSNWQLRNAVKGGLLGQWGVNLAWFGQNPYSLATFGGGDLSIIAGRDVTTVSAAAADSMAVLGSTQTRFSSGGLAVTAGRDVATGQFFAADGVATLNAGRSIATTPTVNPSGTTVDLGSLFALGNSSISVWAEQDITIEAIVNPTILAQPKLNLGGSVFFFSYGPESALNAQSTVGNIVLPDPNSATKAALLLGDAVARGPQSFYAVDPASLRLTSLTQDILVAGATLFPSASGQLQMFAGRDIPTGTVYMSDAPDSVIPTVTNVKPGLSGIALIYNISNASPYNFFGDRHVNDTQPASIVAGRDIGGPTGIVLSLPKAGRIEAGRDIVNLKYTGQNLNTTDLTLISAGRDFADQTTFNDNGSPNGVGVVQVGGPGRLDILAGRNIDLGFSQGVTTVGNLQNANLSTATGADITMLAGLGQDPQYSAFYQKIIAPSATYQQALVTYVESLTGQSNLSVAQAETAFTGFTADQQRALIDKVFFNELDLSGIEANTKPKVGFSRGYAAIDALFPASRKGTAGYANNPYGGDLNLTYSQIYTLSGGNISLLVPGGVINAGLANAPSGVATKPPSQLGIVAQGSGNVDIYTSGDVNVNASRIFTLGGGNILIWSDEGNIDAGNGAKSSLSLPPPTTTVDDKGNVVLVFDAGVAGSGIRTIQTSSSQAAGSVNLIAPTGSVNAGDAGIGAAGNINIAAVTVTGVGNINFGGTATGVPAQVSGLTASLAGAASAASSATTSATSSFETGNKQEAAPVTQAAVSWLDVFVTGLGEENCKPDDVECLKRQKHD